MQGGRTFVNIGLGYNTYSTRPKSTSTYEVESGHVQFHFTQLYLRFIGLIQSKNTGSETFSTCGRNQISNCHFIENLLLRVQNRPKKFGKFVNI